MLKGHNPAAERPGFFFLRELPAFPQLDHFHVPDLCVGDFKSKHRFYRVKALITRSPRINV